jgi:hypothetical protein
MTFIFSSKMYLGICKLSEQNVSTLHIYFVSLFKRFLNNWFINFHTVHLGCTELYKSLIVIVNKFEQKRKRLQRFTFSIIILCVDTNGDVLKSSNVATVRLATYK